MNVVIGASTERQLSALRPSARRIFSA